MNVTFVRRMLVRELRASWRRLAFFFLCVAVGVGAIAALRSVVENVRTGLAREARTLLGGDLAITTNRGWTSDLRQHIDDRLAAFHVVASTDVTETPTMVRPDDEAKSGVRMVELQAVDDRYPLYGRIVLAGGAAYDHSLLARRGALVRPEILSQLQIAVGDRIRIGQAVFEIRGVIEREPSRQIGFFTLGPRVMIDAADLEATRLLTFGSRASFRRLLRLTETDLEPLVKTFRADFAREFVSARSFRGREDQIGEDLQRTENYLSLVGFVIVVLGGIGVWSVTRVFVQQKLKTIAVLKCVGATTGELLATYVLQMLTLALAGSAFGIGLAGLALRWVPASLVAGVSEPVNTLTRGAMVQGVAVGALVTVLFAMVPLLDVRSVKPLVLLRDETGNEALPLPAGRRGGWRDRLRRVGLRRSRRALPTAAVAMGLVGVAAWQAGSFRVGAILCAGFVGVVLALHLAGLALVRTVAPLARARWFPLRHAVLGLNRPGNQTRVVLLAVGLGSFFILSVSAIQANLLDELNISMREGGPDMFLLDVQEDQREGVERFFADDLHQSVRLLPVLRARVTGVRGRELTLESFEDVRGRGSLAREYTVTYRPALEENESIVDGRFWDSTAAGAPEVSIEESLQQRFDLHVGDRMRFDILGRIIEATVTSVRHVNWKDSRSGGFMFVFRPGALDEAPHTYIGIARTSAQGEERGVLQRRLVDRFPNVSTIDVREVVNTVRGVVANVTLAISVVGTMALLSGMLILVGSVALTKVQRLYESALFKTLGAPAAVIATMVTLEYATLGLIAGAVGAVGAQGLSWALSRHVLDIAWSPQLDRYAVGVATTSALVAFVGLAASLDVLSRKPLAILRAG